MRGEQERLAAQAGSHLGPQAFVFSFEPGGAVPPYPDSFSHALSRIHQRRNPSPDVHLHSPRHFHATVLDPVISEAQERTRLRWSSADYERVWLVKPYPSAPAFCARQAVLHGV